MAEVLSQSQIDALLASIGGEEPEKEEVVEEEPVKDAADYPLYDFYSPKKFTKDKLKIVSNVYEHYARVITSLMSSLFRMNGLASVSSVEEQRYYEFRNAIGDHDIIAFCNVVIPNSSKNPPIVMHVSQTLMLDIIDHMLGGVGDVEAVGDDYSYSDIEKELYKTVVKYFTTSMNDSWSGFVKLEATFSQVEENNSVQKSIGLDEIIVICSIQLQLENSQGKITVCIPSGLLDNIFKLFDSQDIIDEDEWQGRNSTRKRIMSSIKDSSLDIVAQLGDVSMSIDDICSLAKGDVINLNKPKDSDVTLLVEGIPWYRGVLGVHKKNLAVEIEKICEEAGAAQARADQELQSSAEK